MDFEHLKMRNLGLIVEDEIQNRRSENIVMIGVGYEEMANNLRNYVPVKPYEGKKRDHALKYLAEYLLFKMMPAKDVREVVV